MVDTTRTELVIYYGYIVGGRYNKNRVLVDYYGYIVGGSYNKNIVHVATTAIQLVVDTTRTELVATTAIELVVDTTRTELLYLLRL